MLPQLNARSWFTSVAMQQAVQLKAESAPADGPGELPETKCSLTPYSSSEMGAISQAQG